MEKNILFFIIALITSVALGTGFAQTDRTVGPLLKFQWSQDAPYNNLFPLIYGHDLASWSNGRLVTDCSTTALAQIMAFHRHPVRGSGQSSVVNPHNITVPLVNLNLAYDWDNMLNTYQNANSGNERQQNAVATLMYHVGLIRGMEGGFISAFTSLFGYDRSFQVRYRKFYTDAEWETIIREQLNSRLPVYYYGNYPTDYPSTTGYHAFVVDGYDNNGMFHINWGWNGQHDGWYSLNNLDPKATPDMYTNEYIYINIKPNSGSAGSNEMGLEALTASKNSVSQNEQFSVTFRLMSFGFFSGGQRGIALVDTNGRIVTIIGAGNTTEWRPGSSASIDISCFVPETVSPGQYRVMVVTRPTGGEWKIVMNSAVRNGIPNAVNLFVTAERGTTGGGYGLGLSVFSVNKSVVSRNETFLINYRLRNMSNDQFPINGQFGAALVDDNGDIAAIVGSRNYSWALDPGWQTSSSEMNCTVPNTVAAGRYRLRMVIRPAGGEWRIVTMSIDNTPISIDFTVR